jgi:peptidoglycan/LPS O-acetylase OafA/YrhL
VRRPTSTARVGSRLAGLDSLRAIAVTAVVPYHLGIEWLPDGFLCVDLFFVISGCPCLATSMKKAALTGQPLVSHSATSSTS